MVKHPKEHQSTLHFFCLGGGLRKRQENWLNFHQVNGPSTSIRGLLWDQSLFLVVLLRTTVTPSVQKATQTLVKVHVLTGVITLRRVHYGPSETLLFNSSPKKAVKVSGAGWKERTRGHD